MQRVVDDGNGSRAAGKQQHRACWESAPYHLDPETATAEFALVVSDAYQRQGLGRHLMQHLIDIAQHGVQRLVGQVLAENTPMLHLMQSLGFSSSHAVEDQVVSLGAEAWQSCAEGSLTASVETPVFVGLHFVTWVTQ